MLKQSHPHPPTPPPRIPKLFCFSSDSSVPTTFGKNQHLAASTPRWALGALLLLTDGEKDEMIFHSSQREQNRTAPKVSEPYRRSILQSTSAHRNCKSRALKGTFDLKIQHAC